MTLAITVTREADQADGRACFNALINGQNVTVTAALGEAQTNIAGIVSDAVVEYVADARVPAPGKAKALRPPRGDTAVL